MWLFPLYLLGAAALAVPVLVHLRNQRMQQVQVLPTLRFIAASTLKTSRWRELQRWLVLLLRLLLIIGLVIAFAQPWKADLTPATGVSAVLVLDRSASMQARGVWSEAQDAARTWIARQPDEARVALIAADRQPQTVVQFADHRSRLLNAVNAQEPGNGGTDLDGALRAADALLRSESAATSRIALISDLSTSACRGIAFDQPLSPGVALEVLPVGTTAPHTWSVMAVQHPAVIQDDEGVVDLVAEIRNRTGATGHAELRVQVDDGPEVIRPITLPDDGSQSVSIPLRSHRGHPLTGRVRIVSGIGDAGDDLGIDDQRWFTIPTRGTATIAACVDGSWDPRFLAAATEPGHQDRFCWLAMSPANLDPTNATVLVISPGTPLSVDRARIVRAHIVTGHPTVVLLDGRPWAGWATESLPFSAKSVEQRDGLMPAERITGLDLRHPILRCFAVPGSGDLGGFAVQRWQPITGGHPLLRLSTGDALLSIVSAPGRLAVFALPPDRRWSDWPAHPTFLPVWQQTLAWLVERGGMTNDALIGDLGITAAAPGIITTAAGTLRAVNIDPREAETDRWTNLQAFARLKNPADPRVILANRSQDAEADARHLAWWVLLTITGLALVELLLANRTPR